MRLLKVNLTETLFKEIYFVTVQLLLMIGYCLFGIRIFFFLNLNLRLKKDQAHCDLCFTPEGEE